MTTHPMVFVVDDDPGIRQSLVWLIESVGLAARAYSTAREFLDDYDPALRGCLVVDVCMPGTDGFALEDILARRSIAIPIVFISGHPDVCAEDGIRPAPVDCLAKPFTDDAFLDRVHRAIELACDARREPTVA